MQRLDAMGAKQLGADGILVDCDSSMGAFKVVSALVKDSVDNFILGVTVSDGNLGHVHKLDVDGNHLCGAAGVTFENGFALTLLPLTSGETIVS